MTNEMQKKLRELLTDEDFSKRAIMATSYSEEVELLKEYGIEISEEELKAYGDEVITILKEDGYISEDDELSSEILEQVSGGRGNPGWSLMGLGVTGMGIGLASDYLAGACAVGLVSNPLGWFIGGAALLLAGGYVLTRKKR